jgi:hypothetical protein
MKAARIALLILAAQALLAQQDPAAGSLQGNTFVSSSEEPVAGAVIELRRIESGSADSLFAATQSNGTFLFRSVPPGRYMVVASRNGYLRAELGQRNAVGPGVPLLVTAGQQTTGLRIAMTPTSAISGRIVDQSGQAMPGVAVQLLKPIFQDGRRTMAVMKSMLTNDLGEYRIFWVPPGSYYVNVLPPSDTPVPGGIPLVINPNGLPGGRSLWSDQSNVALRPVGTGLPDTEAYLPIFFPGTADESAATIVELQSGADVRGIDMRLTPVRAQRVRGLVLNASTRQPAPGATVQMISLVTGRPLQANVDAMGMFTIPRVPSGPYALLASLNPAGIGKLMNIDVRDADIETRIEMQPFLSISGRLSAPNPTAFAVRLRLDYPIANPPQLNATPAPDGSFTFRNVPPGDYRVFVAPILLPQTPPPPPIPPLLRSTYVRSIRMRDMDLLNGPLHVDQAPESAIDVTLATDPGSLNGSVRNGRQEPARAVTVVLLPEVERRLFRTDLFRVTTTDESGQFLMDAIPAGDYRVFAWENVTDREWHDPDFMRRHEDMGRPVRISEGARQAVSLTAIP